MVRKAKNDSVKPRGPQKSPAHLFLMPVIFGVMGATTFGIVQLVCILASCFRPGIQSFASYQEATKTWLVLLSFFASFPIGFIAANLFIYAISPLRRFFTQEASNRNGETFTKAMRGLLKFALYWTLPLVVVCFWVALLGK